MPPRTPPGPRAAWRRRARAAALAAFALLGVSHMAGTLLTPLAPSIGAPLAGVGRLTLASPHPKVFCQTGEHEPFGFAFEVEAVYQDGQRERFPIGSDAYSRIPGPYMYRNVYGAMLAFGPLLDPDTVDAVMRFGLCAPDGDLRPMLGRPDAPLREAVVSITPRGVGPDVAPTRVVCAPATPSAPAAQPQEAQP